MSRRHFWETPQLLCTPEAIFDEENEILRLHALPHSETEHQALVERWRAAQSAKQWLQETLALVDVLPEREPSTPPGCKVCLSTPCSCERYKR